MENFQGDGEFRSKRRTKTERRSNASFGLTYVEVFHLVLARSTCHSASPAKRRLQRWFRLSRNRRPETHAAHPAADEAEQLDFPGSKNTLAATLPGRGKLGLKHLELATACDAFQESRGQPRVVVRPRPAAHGTSGRWCICIILPPRSQATCESRSYPAGRLGRSDKSRRASGHPSPLGWDFGSAGCQMRAALAAVTLSSIDVVAPRHNRHR